MELIDQAVTQVQVLPVEEPSGMDCLFRLQVTASSTLGGLALNCGGLLVDHHWLRILGGGAEGLPSLAEANGLADPTPQSGPPPTLVVGYDVLGGRFAINGGGLNGEVGVVYYFGPDTLDWTPIGGGHSQFVRWALGGGLVDFYADLRWPGWETEVQQLAPAQGIAFFPFLFTREGRDVASATRSVVPYTELLTMLDDLAGQASGTSDETTIQINIED